MKLVHKHGQQNERVINDILLKELNKRSNNKRDSINVSGKNLFIVTSSSSWMESLANNWKVQINERTQFFPQKHHLKMRQNVGNLITKNFSFNQINHITQGYTNKSTHPTSHPSNRRRSFNLTQKTDTARRLKESFQLLT